MNNANVVIREDINVDQLIDVIESNKVYLPCITVLNKIDMVKEEQLNDVKKRIKPDLCVSADKGIKIEELKDLIFKKLNLIRIYLKEYGKKADMEEPMIMWSDCTLRDLCSKLHKDFVVKFRYAKVWGNSVKYDGMKILKLQHALKDKDVVELRMN